MSTEQSITETKHIMNKQYRDASNLNARLSLHQQFSTNKYGWERWLFDQFKFPLRGRILELGCGTGKLWLENLDRIPAGLEVILSDLSAGMVQEARCNIGHTQPFFQFEIVDAQSIPFDDKVFDIVIANHMLYHMPEIDKALIEIQRVLKSTGRLYSSTIGKNHLKELSVLISRFDSRLPSWGQLPSDSFSLENGSDQLGRYFVNVSLNHYPDSLIVTDAGMLTDYIASGLMENTSDRYMDLAKFVKQELQANDGRFHITKDWGFFESSGLYF
ncbi:class I SAM-dependent methyltransferase [Chloroflexota bacterium]